MHRIATAANSNSAVVLERHCFWHVIDEALSWGCWT